MELELKHLAPYLPYELNIQLGDGRIKEVIGIRYWIGWCITYKSQHGETNTSIKYAEPILKSLQKFDQDEFFKLQDFIGLGNWCDAYDEYFTAWFDDAANVDKLILQAPYKVIQFFFSEHYDIFGLIDAGLAVELKD